MRIFLLAFIVVSLAFSGCTQGPADSPRASDAASDSAKPQEDALETAIADLTVGEPLVHENLTIFPVVSQTARNEDRYITLDEGLKAGTVEILEVGGAEGMNPPANVDPQTTEVAPAEEASDAPNQLEGGGASPTDAPADEPTETESTESAAAEAQSPESGRTETPPAGEVAAEETPADPRPEADNATDANDAGDADDGEATSGQDRAESEAESADDADDNEAAGGDLIQASDFEGLAPAEPPEEPAEEFEGPRDPSLVPTFPNEPTDEGESGQEATPPVGDAPPLENVRNLTQQAAGGDVNRLMVINRSERPLYLMPGEIIVGGSQDHTIGRELVIAPTGKPTPIDVFCVEAQRWGGRASDQTAMLLSQAVQNPTNAATVTLSEDATPEMAAEQAGRGKFVASVGNLSKSARLAVQQSGDQSEVWKKVAAANAQSGVKPDSGAFTHNYVEAQAVQRLEPYLEALEQPVAETQRVVGVVVAIDGKLETIDVFESTPLFKKLWPKLLKSYALDAATSQPADAERPEMKQVTREAAGEFLSEAVRAQVEHAEDESGIALVRRRGEGVVSFSAQDPDASTDEAAPSDALHISAFAQ